MVTRPANLMPSFRAQLLIKKLLSLPSALACNAFDFVSLRHHSATRD